MSTEVSALYKPKNKPIKKKHGFIREIKTNKILFLMLLVPFVYIVIQYYAPMLGLVVAFKNYNYNDGIFNSPWCGLDNFKFLFQSSDAWIITRNTICFNLVFIFLGLFFAVAFSIMLNELRNKFAAKFYQSVMFLPYFMSWVVVAYMIYSLLQPDNGLIPRQMKAFGMIAPNFYENMTFWPFILTFCNLWKWVGYNSVIYLCAISGIDETYYEAAMLDGCSKLQQVKYITLPFLKPTIIVLTIMNLGNVFRSDFGLFYQVTMDSGLLYPVTNTIDTYVYRGLMTTGNVGMASAAGFYQSVVGFVVVMIANLIITKISPEDRIF